MSGNNNTGSDPVQEQLEADSSIDAFISSLLVNTAVAAGMFVAFCIVRHWNRKIYQPRTYLVPESVRSPPLPPGIFSWITASFSVKDTELLERVGLDAYMFLRFLRMSAIFFAGCTLLGIPILIPINVVGGDNVGGLTNMTIGNVIQSWRLWFHLVLTILFCSTAVVLLWREMQEYCRRRHAYLLSEKHAKTPQATTILVRGIPDGLNTEDALFNIFNKFPSGVKKIWLTRHPKNIVELCKERDEIVKKLEMAVYNYIRSAYGKKSKKSEVELEPVRPAGRTSVVPCVGKKVDLIDFYSNRLAQLNREIDAAQEAGSVKSLNSAFIQFHTQFAAHSAVQTVVHPTAFNMAPMYAEISPLDVVWDSMDIHAVFRQCRVFLSFTAATALALFWTIPVFFVSSIANIASIVNTFSFLAFLEDLPAPALGIIQGVLPPLFLAILMALLPIILTFMANFEGHVRYSAITHSVMSKFFFFLVVNVLLISTLSGGFLKTWEEISKGGFNFFEIINLLSKNLPGASTFFVTYALLKGFTGPVLELLQISPLILNFLLTNLLARSPRQIWDIQGRLISANYGVIFPPQTLMFCIGIVYSTIAPLVLPFVTFYFTMFYFVYRHQFLYIYHQPVETGGLAFPKAVRQSFTGIFIAEFTILGIFLAKQATLNIVPQMVLMVILIASTAFALSSLNRAFDPLVTFLPVALFSKDLHVDKDGVVTNGNPAKAFAQAFVSTIGVAEEGVKTVTSRAQQLVSKLTGSKNESSVMAMENRSNHNLTRISDVPTVDSGATADMSGHYHLDSSKQEYYDAVELDSYNRASTVMRPPGPPFEQSPSFAHHGHPFTAASPEQSVQSQSPPQVSSQYLSSPPMHHSPYMHPGRTEGSLKNRSASLASKPASVMDRPVSYMDRPASFRGSDNPLPREDQLPEPAPIDPELERMQDRAYCHPAIYNVQTPVWLPQDTRGLVQDIITKLSGMGISVATDGAGINSATAKASVGNIIYAPGEEERYRLERGDFAPEPLAKMDDDFDDFGDIDEAALATSLDEFDSLPAAQPMVLGQHINHNRNASSSNPSSASSAPRTFQQTNLAFDGNKSLPTSSGGSSASSRPVGTPTAPSFGKGVITKEDYDDFDDWPEDFALSLADVEQINDNKVTGSTIGNSLHQQSPRPTAPPPAQKIVNSAWPNMNRANSTTSTPSFPAQQPRPQQQTPQPTKLFSIFGNATAKQTAQPIAGNGGGNGNQGQALLQRSDSAKQWSGSFGQQNTSSATALSRTSSSSSWSNSGNAINRTFSNMSAGAVPHNGNNFEANSWRPPNTTATAPFEQPTHHAIDYEAIKTWQYPINYPKRDYQFNIIRTALFTNTLVALPTGLGKTFIAAVVMLNYFRWFPNSKVVFMAPTKPLVAQQIEACFKVCGIPQDVTVELTGAQAADQRIAHWKEKRLIFCTPQVINNDIKTGICPMQDIVCLVFDEAHKAAGKYAYAEIIRQLDSKNDSVRILALSATPGNDAAKVKDLVLTLKVAKIEARTEDSIDLHRYIHKRETQEVQVPYGNEISEIRQKFQKVMEPFLNRLKSNGVIDRNLGPDSLSRYVVVQRMGDWSSKNPGNNSRKSMLYKDSQVLAGLLYAHEMLSTQGIRLFFSTMDPASQQNISTSRNGSGQRKHDYENDIGDAPKKEEEVKTSQAIMAVQHLPAFQALMSDIRAKIRRPNFISHPKVTRLENVIVQHFVDHQEEVNALMRAKRYEREGSASLTEPQDHTGDEGVPQTRVIVFADRREMVLEITRVLELHRPLAVEDFQRGEHNVLVATVIGEEGLDIGDVDLIVCYDSQSSPTRMIQRMGRTGRKRKGKITLLMTDREAKKYREAVSKYKSVQRMIAQTSFQMFPFPPRILPQDCNPICEEIRIDIPDYITPVAKGKRGAGLSFRQTKLAGYLEEEEEVRFRQNYWVPRNTILKINMGTAMSRQRKRLRENRGRVVPDWTSAVGHSDTTLGYLGTVDLLSNLKIAGKFSLEQDPYSIRMLELLNLSPPLEGQPFFTSLASTLSKKMDTAVTAYKPRDAVRNRQGNDDRLHNLDYLDDSDLDLMHDGANTNRKRRKQDYNRYKSNYDSLSEERSEGNDNFASDDDRAPSKSTIKSKAKRVRRALLQEGTLDAFFSRAPPNQNQGEDDSRRQAKTDNTTRQQPVAETISDDEVDMAIMGGLGGMFEFDDLPAPARHRLRRVIEDDGDTANPKLSAQEEENDYDFNLDEDWGAGIDDSHWDANSRDESGGRHKGQNPPKKGFDFSANLNHKRSRSSWYTSEQSEEESEGAGSATADQESALSDGTTVLMVLPPVPPPGQWYRAAA
ncbi:hypothetical protein BG004_004704 [Podila humilis]|nr:hypothetical protein BG004_004704 [Podila humilis]